MPLRAGTVVLPGEPVAMIAEQNFVLRLRVPERHARFLKAGDPVRIDARSFGERGRAVRQRSGWSIRRSRMAAWSPTRRSQGLGDYFVGERIRVWISAGERAALS